MAKKRPTLRLLPDEDRALRELYKLFRIPTDQYPQRPDDLARLVATWSELTGRNEASADVLHYMITRRKDGDWEKLGRDAGQDFSRTVIELSAEEFKHLDAIHEELQIASDNFALNTDLAQKLQQEFAKRAKRIVPAMVLAAAMINRRKAGVLATLRPKSDSSDLGFSDIGSVVG